MDGATCGNEQTGTLDDASEAVGVDHAGQNIRQSVVAKVNAKSVSQGPQVEVELVDAILLATESDLGNVLVGRVAWVRSKRFGAHGNRNGAGYGEDNGEEGVGGSKDKRSAGVLIPISSNQEGGACVSHRFITRIPGRGGRCEMCCSQIRSG